MEQDLLVVKSLGTHHGSTDLAQTHAVAPPCPAQDKLGRIAVLAHIMFLDHKGRAVQARG